MSTSAAGLEAQAERRMSRRAWADVQGSAGSETTAAAMGDAPRWFQLYWSTSDDLVDSFLQRAAAVDAGAVVVTLDTIMLGWRPRDLDLGSLPFSRGGGLAQYTSGPVFRRLLDDVPAAGGRPRISPRRSAR